MSSGATAGEEDLFGFYFCILEGVLALGVGCSRGVRRRIRGFFFRLGTRIF